MSGQPSPVDRLHANLAYLKQKGASPSRIQQEVQRFKESQDAISAQERKLSGAEKVAAVGSKLASGATLGFFDELAGLGGQGEKDTQRYLQHQLEEENPATAFAAEVVGSAALPFSFLKAPGELAVGATELAKAANLAKRIGTVVGEGAIQGGIAGAGTAEGSLEDRIRGAGRGGLMGGASAGLLGGVVRGASGLRKAGAKALDGEAPALEDLISQHSTEDVARAKLRLEEIKQRGLEGEARMADVLPNGEGYLRSQRTAGGKDVAKRIDRDLRDRSTRLANVADDRFSMHTGTQRQSARKSVEALNEEAAQRAGPFYSAAEQEAAAGGGNSDVIGEALELPYVKQRIGQLRATPRSKFTQLADDDHVMLDQVYKDIGREIRALPREKWSLKDDLIQQRAVLADALTSRAPSYKRALSEFADPMGRRDAYELGSRKSPADIIPSELKGLDPAEATSYREGKAQTLRANVPNADLGEFARFSDVMAPVSNKEKTEVFKATFGDKAYREYLRDLMEMAKMQRMRGGSGESTTVDKLREQMLASDNSDLHMIAAQLAMGNIAGAGRNIVGKVLGHVPGSRLLASKKNAQSNVDWLLGPATPQTLDDMVRTGFRRQQPRRPGFGEHRVLRATARIVGGETGKQK